MRLILFLVLVSSAAVAAPRRIMKELKPTLQRMERAAKVQRRELGGKRAPRSIAEKGLDLQREAARAVSELGPGPKAVDRPGKQRAHNEAMVAAERLEVKLRSSHGTEGESMLSLGLSVGRKRTIQEVRVDEKGQTFTRSLVKPGRRIVSERSADKIEGGFRVTKTVFEDGHEKSRLDYVVKDGERPSRVAPEPEPSWPPRAKR
jgi:hypothetical protein